MDTNKEYIEMCEKAKEIQKIRKPGLEEAGDYYYLDHNRIIVAPDRQVCISDFEYCDYLTWLPRQDQLQDILKYTCPPWVLCDMVSVFGKDNERQFDVSSMEQFWLAFVMKEKYNKTWVNEDWVSPVNDNIRAIYRRHNNGIQRTVS